MLNKIIVLGMDNTGKTTLCKSLSKLLDYKHVNSLGPQAPYMEMTGFINDTMESPDPMVLERFCFFEEMVYGNILRGRSKFDWDSIYLKTIIRANPLIIYCRPHTLKVLNFGEREQMAGVIEKGEDLLEAYDNLYITLARMGFNTLVYDYSYTTPEELADKIKIWKGEGK